MYEYLPGKYIFGVIYPSGGKPPVIFGKCQYVPGVNMPVWYFDEQGVFVKFVWINLEAVSKKAALELQKKIAEVYQKFPKGGDELKKAMDEMLEKNKDLVKKGTKTDFQWDTGKTWPKDSIKPPIPPKPK